MKITLTLLSSLLFMTSASAQTIVGRGELLKKGIGLLDTSIMGLNEGWGGLARSAHHATVAMNDSGDILVAYNSERADFQTSLGLPVLQQVEIAYFEYLTASDTWDLINQQLVGSIESNPLFPLFDQEYTACLKPDVVSIGNKFFIVWTRQYDQDYNPLGAPIPPQRDAPSVLECVWIEKTVAGAVAVYNDSLLQTFGDGVGFPLDISYDTRDCNGVADAVVLQPTSGSDPIVAVVYPRQTKFGGYVPDAKREFDLAVVTCSIGAGNLLTNVAPEILKDDVIYEGPLAPTDSAVVLPDAAPTMDPEAFWLTYEQQFVGTGGNVGRMALEYWKYLPGVPRWDLVGSKSVVDSTPLGSFFRRRPTVSSLPRVGFNEAVSIAHGTFLTPGGDTNVVYEQWQILAGGLSPLPIPAGAAFPNDSAITDSRPLPVHGPDIPNYLRRCYFTRDDPSNPTFDGVYRYRMVDSFNLVQLISDGPVGGSINGTTAATRAAADFGGVHNSLQTVPVIWEDKLYPFGGVDYLRIVLMVD